MPVFPRVDIIVVTYNGSQYISACLQSLFNLDYPKKYYRIIVIDNSSVDNTRELLKEWNGITVYLNKKKLRFCSGK